MNAKLFAGHLLKVTLLLIGTHLLALGLFISFATTYPQVSISSFKTSFYANMIGKFICAVAMGYFMGKFRLASILVGLLAFISPGLAGIFSLFLKLDQFKNEK